MLNRALLAFACCAGLHVAGCTTREQPRSTGEAGAGPAEASDVDGAVTEAGKPTELDAAPDAAADTDASLRTVDVFLELVPTGNEESLRLRIPEIHLDKTFFAFCGSAGLGCILAPHGSSALFYYGTDMFEEWGAVRACGSKVVVRRSTSRESAPAKTKTAVYPLPDGTVAELHLRGERGARRLREGGSPVDRSDPACPP